MGICVMDVGYTNSRSIAFSKILNASPTSREYQIV